MSHPMPSPFKFSTLAHADRTFLGPYGAKVVVELARGIEGVVVDVGCGKGAALEVTGGRGIGIEHNPVFAAEARDRNPSAEILEADARSCFDQAATGADLIICLGASQAIGSPTEAIARFGPALSPGGHLLFGDGYWRMTPDPAYLAFLGAQEVDMPTHEESCLLGKGAGFEHLDVRESSQEDWDEYEDSYYRSMMYWCAANPEDPDADAFAARIEAWRGAYLSYGRDTLGFAIHLFRKGS